MSHRKFQADSQALINAIKFPEGITGTSLKEWDRIIRLAKRANLIGRLAESVQRAGVLHQLPEVVGIHLESALALSTHQQQAITWEIRHIARALQNIGSPVVLLKGAAYAMSGLSAAEGRLFGDVDILVHREKINHAEAALMMQGWSSGTTDTYDDRYYRRWMHELPPMSHCKRGTVIDVHHNILPLTARNSPSSELLMRNIIQIPGSDMKMLSPCDMVIHSATHLFHEGELQNGLRDLFDLDALLTELPTIYPAFWTEITERAGKLNLSLPLHLALRYTRLFLGTAVPERVVSDCSDQANLSQLAQTLFDWMYLRALQPDHQICSDTSTKIARIGIFIRSHYLKMSLGLLALHLGRKFVMRLYKNTSRSV